MAEGAEPALTGGQLLARNALWGFLAQILPMAVALFTIPWLIRGLGVERFGILALAWLVVGYFSVFDLGLGRALTKVVAEKLGKGEDAEIPTLVWTGLALMLAFGLAGTVVVAALSPWLVGDVLKIPPDLRAETLRSFLLLAFFIPVVIVISGLRGILEAYQRFNLIARVSIPTGVYTYLGPLFVLPFSNDLPVVVAMLVAGRVVACFAYLAFCLQAAPDLRANVGLDRSKVRQLIAFGGWLTVTNIVAPFMVYLDRFLIGALISVAAVAYYVTPYDVVTRLWLISGTVAGVLFPAFAASFHVDRRRLVLLYGKGLKYVYLALFPVVVCIVGLAHEGLHFWLGEEFASHSDRVLQWLAAGVLFNAIGGISSTLLQGAGRPDIQAKLHLLELPFYLGVLWWVTTTHGVVGAATVWTLRIVLDWAAVSWLLGWLVPEAARVTRRIFVAMLVAGGILLLAALLPGGWGKVLVIALFLSLFAPGAWFFGLSPRERGMVRAALAERLRHRRP